MNAVDPWFRVYAADGKRLLVQAADEARARDLALERWRTIDRYTTFASVRPAREDEVAAHLASVSSMTGQRPGRELAPIPLGLEERL
jgi:hypothetical protein